LTLLADTHVWYRWLHEPRRLSRAQARILTLAERRSTPIAVSSMSLWELALLAVRQRVRVHGSLKDWLSDMAAHPLIEVLSISAEVAAEGAQLGPVFQGDPADRIIVATARCHGLRLLTSDQRIRDWGGVSVI